MKVTNIERRPKMTRQQMDHCLLHMIRDPGLFAFAAERLRATDFSQASEMQYALVWSSALAVAERNGGNLPEQSPELPIAMELISKIDNSEASEVTPETAKIAEALLAWIYQMPGDVLNPQFYRPLIQDLIIERAAVGQLSKLVTQARDVGRPIDLPETLEQAAAQIRQIESSALPTCRSLASEWQEYEARLEVHRGKEMLGLKTGMQQLDQRTLGLRGMTVLGAMPNVGKTAFTLQLGINVVRNNPDACFLLVSLEMGRHDLYTRIHCNLAEMDYKTLVFGPKEPRGAGSAPFTQDHRKRLDVATDWVAANGKRIRILDRETVGPKVTASSILGALNTLKAECGAGRAFIVIDYLQLLPVPAEVLRQGDLEADKYRVRVAQDVVAGTKTDANTVGDAVMVISEARKPAAGRKGWGTELADLMGSSRLGYAADAVLLYRRMDDEDIEQAYDVGAGRIPTSEQLEERGISPAFLTLAKGRDGMRRGEWPIEYHFERSTFREIEHPRGRAAGRVQRPPARRQMADEQIPPRQDLFAAMNNYN